MKGEYVYLITFSSSHKLDSWEYVSFNPFSLVELGKMVIFNMAISAIFYDIVVGGWIDGRIDGWIDGWMNEWMNYSFIK